MNTDRHAPGPFLVYSREHNAFWRPKAAGYTYDINQAGRWSLDAADAHASSLDTDGLNGPSEVVVADPGICADLLEALENIENDDGRIPSTIWAMRNSAIAKARGES